MIFETEIASTTCVNNEAFALSNDAFTGRFGGAD